MARATFFRYFDAKETAVAEGFSIPWMTLLVDNLETQPPDLSALDAVIECFLGFGADFDPHVRNLVLQQAQMSQASPALAAWTLALYVRFELAIADAVGHRFPDLQPDDPRTAPRRGAHHVGRPHQPRHLARLRRHAGPGRAAAARPAGRSVRWRPRMTTSADSTPPARHSHVRREGSTP